MFSEIEGLSPEEDERQKQELLLKKRTIEYGDLWKCPKCGNHLVQFYYTEKTYTIRCYQCGHMVTVQNI
jgi:transcription elongation factor Elf1